jgi:hypothetical protein
MIDALQVQIAPLESQLRAYARAARPAAGR